ncbi:MAG TPA: lysine--tRNA ligase [Candidatus Omnitrophota bacterium]|nr:lysine--tRNA ligase [Candidatus Omnitrophota bacterium]
MEIHEIRAQRENKLKSLRDKGIDAFSAPSPDRLPIGEVIKDFKEGSRTTVSGRIMAKRSHGKVTFVDLRDATGRIQLYVKADHIGPEGALVFQEIDIGDFVTAFGELFMTHTGEPTMKLEKFSILAKSLMPLPEKWHGLKDVELRYRQRYLDLISNEEVKSVFKSRCAIIRSIRSYLDSHGYLEVETPMMHDIPGGAAGRPFKTHHNAFDMNLYMRIAPELYLKRLIVGGLDRVYEINRSFRNEGISTRHNPEFTMLEAYCAYSNFEGMMDLAEELIVNAAQATGGTTEIVYQGTSISLARPWRRVSFAHLVKDKFGIDPSDEPDVMLQKLHDKNVAKDSTKLSRSQVTKVIEDILEEEIGANPTFVTDFFTSMSPLAKTRKDNPLLSERFELYIAGFEMGNAYSELNDALEQKRRFEEEITELATDEKKSLDEDYCLALEHGMPATGGLGIGVDRLVMLLTNQPSIRDVILFPLLKPVEEHHES